MSEFKKRVRRVAWFGPAAGELGWLRTRVEQLRGRRHGQAIDCEVVDMPDGCGAEPSQLGQWIEEGWQDSNGLDRLIIGCEDRVAFPAALVQWWLRNVPEVPLALATGSWWDGSRRTGTGSNANSAGSTPQYANFAWHRWSDNWLDWLSATTPQTASSSARWDCRGMIIGNCRQTMQAWVAAAKSTGYSAEVCSCRHWEMDQVRAEPSWVLIDDTCGDTWGQSFSGECLGGEVQMLGILESAAERFPDSLRIVATGFPRFEIWQAAQERGAHEMLGKPYAAQALANVLGRAVAP